MLVVQTGYLGDVVLSTPVLAALKRRWPEARVTVLVRPEVAPLLRSHPDVDEVIVNDKRGEHAGIRGFLRQVRAIRAGRHEVGIGLHRGTRAALLMTLAEIPLRVGFRQAEVSFLYHRRARRDPARHDVERQLAILAPLGFDGGEASPPRLAVDADARRAVDDLLVAAGVAPESRFVLMAPGSAWLTKQWMPERFAEVARLLLARGEAVVYTGTTAEAPTAEEVRRQAGGGASLAGRTDVAGLVALVSRAAAVVCNDSAPMHVAQALGVPLVAIVGPTSSAQGFLPRIPPFEVLTDPDLTCRPLCRFGGKPCALGTRACLAAIAPAAVLAALDLVRAGADVTEVRR